MGALAAPLTRWLVELLGSETGSARSERARGSADFVAVRRARVSAAGGVRPQSGISEPTGHPAKLGGRRGEASSANSARSVPARGRTPTAVLLPLS